MDPTLVAILLLACGTAAGIVSSIVVAWLNRHKTRADASQSVAEGADKVVDSALALVVVLEQDVKCLKMQMAELNGINGILAQRVTALEEENRALEALKQRVAELEGENKSLRALVEKQGEHIAKLEAELEAYRNGGSNA